VKNRESRLINNYYRKAHLVLVKIALKTTRNAKLKVNVLQMAGGATLAAWGFKKVFYKNCERKNRVANTRRAVRHVQILANANLIK
jgi:hypothetical protein